MPETKVKKEITEEEAQKEYEKGFEKAEKLLANPDKLETFLQKLEKKLKKWFLKYITYRHREYEKKMKTCMNKVRVRKMFTRYGSNSVGRKSITYSTILMHYSSDVIDSVIVHELAHCFEHNHGPNFYKIVRKYCPNYDDLHTRLKKGVYSND